MTAPDQQFSSITECLEAACETRFDLEFFCDPRERLTGREVRQDVEQIAAGFWSAGYRKGDVMAFLCTSSVRHAVTFYACLRVGLVPCALHITDTEDRLSRTLHFIEAKALITDLALVEKARAIWPDGPCLSLDGTDPDSVKALADKRRAPGPDPFFHPDDIALLLMSSGTTGDPKCVMHTVKSLAAMTPLAQELYGCTSAKDSVAIVMSPAFAAWVITSFPMLGLNARFYFQDSFEPHRFLQILQEERITLAPLVPTLWRLILEAGPEAYDLSAIKSVFYSGEPGSADLVSALKDKITPSICTAFLASEGCAASAIAAGPDILLENQILSAAAGRPVTTASVRIVDPDGPIDQEVRDGEIGEIVLQSPSLAAGYLHKPELTKEKFSDSWWRSGDLGLRDENGILFVKGRTDNQINSGGVKVRAEEIENILLQHTDISHAAVVGEPDDTWGERIVAHVVSRSADLTEQTLLKNLKDEDLLPHRLVPKAVHFHAQLPRGATGKLYRRGLRRQPK